LAHLAIWVALRVHEDQREILPRLRLFAELAAERLLEAPSEKLTADPTLETTLAARTDLPEASRAPRVVKMGRLRPQAMRDDEIPADDLVAALDSRRPAEPKVAVLSQRPRVVQLGRLRSGERS
jgi:hypothetical protein